MFSFLRNFVGRASLSPHEQSVDSAVDIDALLRKIRCIEIVSNRIANDVYSGQYKSAFRGQGIEFDEVREYAEGDDVRTIDWNVTARSGKPYVKRFSEERERSLLFLLDVSASNLFGSQASRLETATEIAASLMFSALKNNDKIGLLTFANGVKKFFPPRKGKKYALGLIREMLNAKPTQEKTDLNSALEFVDKTMKRRSVVFILSDFYVPQLETPLFYCKRRHDLIAVSITDPFEDAFPNVGFVKLRDPESGAIVELDAGSSRVRKAVSEKLTQRRKNLIARLKEAHVDSIFVESGSNYVPIIHEFFHARNRR